MAEVRVPKEQLTEIQQAERVDCREWWEEVEGGVEEKEEVVVEDWRTVTGRERRQEAVDGAVGGFGEGGAWEGQLVVYLGKRDGSNCAGEDWKASVREVERNFSY